MNLKKIFFISLCYFNIALAASKDQYVPVLQEPEQPEPSPHSESYEINVGSSSPIEFSVGCRIVTNSTDDKLFIPAQTNEELDSFLTGPPTGVTISFCP